MNLVDYKLYELKVKDLWQSFKSEEASFWFICAYLVIEYVRPHQIWPAIDIIPYANVLIVLSFITAVTSKSKIWVVNPVNKVMLLMLLVVILSSFFAINRGYAFDKLNLYYNWVIIYFLLINIVNSHRRFFLFMILFLLVNFKMSQHASISFAQRGFGFASWGVGGAPGWFQNSGEMGMEMCIFLPLAYYFATGLSDKITKVKKYILYSLPLTALLAIIASSSRGALIGLAGVFLWMFITSKPSFKTTALLVLISFFAYKMIPEESIDRMRAAGEDKTSLSRIEYWDMALDAMNDNPLFGIGFQNWKFYFIRNYDGDVSIRSIELVHNTILEVGSELGYSGLILYIVLVLLVFLNNHRSKKLALKQSDKLMYNIAKGLDAGFIGFLISSMFISTFFYPFIWMQLMLSVSLNAVLKRVNQE